MPENLPKMPLNASPIARSGAGDISERELSRERHNLQTTPPARVQPAHPKKQLYSVPVNKFTAKSPGPSNNLAKIQSCLDEYRSQTPSRPVKIGPKAVSMEDLTPNKRVRRERKGNELSVVRSPGLHSVAEEQAAARVGRFMLVAVWRRRREELRCLRKTLEFQVTSSEKLRIQVSTLKSLLDSDNAKVRLAMRELERLKQLLRDKDLEKAVLEREKLALENDVCVAEDRASEMSIGWRNSRNELEGVRAAAARCEHALALERAAAAEARAMRDHAYSRVSATSATTTSTVATSWRARCEHALALERAAAAEARAMRDHAYSRVSATSATTTSTVATSWRARCEHALALERAAAAEARAMRDHAYSRVSATSATTTSTVATSWRARCEHALALERAAAAEARAMRDHAYSRVSATSATTTSTVATSWRARCEHALALERAAAAEARAMRDHAYSRVSATSATTTSTVATSWRARCEHALALERAAAAEARAMRDHAYSRVSATSATTTSTVATSWRARCEHALALERAAAAEARAMRDHAYSRVSATSATTTSTVATSWRARCEHALALERAAAAEARAMRDHAYSRVSATSATTTSTVATSWRARCEHALALERAAAAEARAMRDHAYSRLTMIEEDLAQHEELLSAAEAEVEALRREAEERQRALDRTCDQLTLEHEARERCSAECAVLGARVTAAAEETAALRGVVHELQAEIARLDAALRYTREQLDWWPRPLTAMLGAARSWFRYPKTFPDAVMWSLVPARQGC